MRVCRSFFLFSFLFYETRGLVHDWMSNARSAASCQSEKCSAGPMVFFTKDTPLFFFSLLFIIEDVRIGGVYVACIYTHARWKLP